MIFLFPEIYASTELSQSSMDSDDTGSLEVAVMRSMSEPEVKIRIWATSAIFIQFCKREEQTSASVSKSRKGITLDHSWSQIS